VIGDPPVLVGANQLTFTCPEPTPDAGATTAVTDCGAPGFVRGVAEAVVEAVPVPAALTAETRNMYGVPLDRPVTVVLVVVDVPSVNVVHVVPPLEEYSTT
jgi:hypothetical protein